MSRRSSTRSKMKSQTKSDNLPHVVKQQQKPENQNFQFINKDISVHLLCPQCLILMKSPQRLHPCGHTFCQLCTRQQKKCPQCQSKVTVVQKDLIGEGLVNQLTVKCLNEGCPYVNSFQNYKKFHQGHCKLKAGLDEWLKNMKSTLNENQSKQRKYSSENESQKSTQKKKIQDDKAVYKIKHSQPSAPLGQLDIASQLANKINKDQQ